MNSYIVLNTLVIRKPRFLMTDGAYIQNTKNPPFFFFFFFLFFFSKH
jgi:hypothetical protein